MGGAPGALDGALAAIDLSRADWSERVSDARLREAARPMDLGRDPSGHHLGVTERDRTALDAFVDAEIEARGVRSAR